MTKQCFLYLILSTLVVLFAQYAHSLLVYIDMLYAYINIKLASIFSLSPQGILIRRVLTLALIPIIVTGIPALLYRLIKKQTMPYLIEITWVLWLILALSKIVVIVR